MADKFNDARYKEAVCIDANRIYDSCCDKDCIENLPVYFTDCTQSIIDRATSVRAKKAEVVNVCVDLEPIPFNRGFYSVDLTFYFDVELEVAISRCTPCTLIHGLAVHSKRVILYGSEGGVKVFSSDFVNEGTDIQEPARNLPKAVCQVASPVVLSAKLVEQKDCCDCCCCCCNVPRSVSNAFDGNFIDQEPERIVYVTLGVFFIAQIERSVSMLIHCYDFCIPEKRCLDNSETPCDLFNKIQFPIDEFFPPRAGDVSQNSSNCDIPTKTCGCGK